MNFLNFYELFELVFNFVQLLSIFFRTFSNVFQLFSIFQFFQLFNFLKAFFNFSTFFNCFSTVSQLFLNCFSTVSQLFFNFSIFQLFRLFFQFFNFSTFWKFFNLIFSLFFSKIVFKVFFFLKFFFTKFQKTFQFFILFLMIFLKICNFFDLGTLEPWNPGTLEHDVERSSHLSPWSHLAFLDMENSSWVRVPRCNTCTNGWAYTSRHALDLTWISLLLSLYIYCVSGLSCPTFSAVPTSDLYCCVSCSSRPSAPSRKPLPTVFDPGPTVTFYLVCSICFLQLKPNPSAIASVCFGSCVQE